MHWVRQKLQRFLNFSMLLQNAWRCPEIAFAPLLSSLSQTISVLSVHIMPSCTQLYIRVIHGSVIVRTTHTSETSEVRCFLSLEENWHCSFLHSRVPSLESFRILTKSCWNTRERFSPEFLPFINISFGNHDSNFLQYWTSVNII